MCTGCTCVPKQGNPICPENAITTFTLNCTPGPQKFNRDGSCGFFINFLLKRSQKITLSEKGWLYVWNMCGDLQGENAKLQAGSTQKILQQKKSPPFDLHTQHSIEQV